MYSRVNDSLKCSRCGTANNEKYGGAIIRHHILPLTQGGKDEPGNIELLCLHCHGKVHYWSGKVDDPPHDSTDKFIRLDIGTCTSLEFYQREGETFNQTIHWLMEEVSSHGKVRKETR